MIILDFFRDFFSGIIYWLYVLVCIFAFFYVLGIVADRKRQAIANKLKEKKYLDNKDSLVSVRTTLYYTEEEEGEEENEMENWGELEDN